MWRRLIFVLMFNCAAAALAADADPLLEELQSIEEEETGEADLSKWAEPDYAYRRVVTLVGQPLPERRGAAVIDGLSIRKLARDGQLGSGVVARSGAAERLEVLHDPQRDACIVRIPPEKQAREHSAIVLYYGDSGTMAMPQHGGLESGYRVYIGPEEPADRAAAQRTIARSIERYAALVLVEPQKASRQRQQPGAHLSTVAALADNDGAVPMDDFVNADERQRLLRVRWHATKRFDTTARVVLSDGKTSQELAMPVAGDGFFWSEVIVSLAPGKWRATLHAPAAAELSADFLTLSPDIDWRPEYESLSGPLWVRFRLPDGAADAESIAVVATHTTYTEIGMLSDPDGEYFANAWFAAPGLRDLFPKRRLQAHLPVGQWTPWGQLRPNGSFTWFETLTIRGGKHDRVELQLAFEPSDNDVFRHATAECVHNQVAWRMPTRPDSFNEAMSIAQTKQDLIAQRLAAAKAAGLTGQPRPTKLAISVMAESFELRQMEEMTLQTLSLVGLNGVNQAKERYADLYDKYQLSQHHDHAWIDEIGTDWDALEGSSYRQKMESYSRVIAAEIEDPRRRRVGAIPHLAPFNILGDEIGPAAEEGSFQADPGLHRLFVAYLHERSIGPDVFGLKSFDEIRWPLPKLGKAGMNEARREMFDQMAQQAMRTQMGESDEEIFLEESQQDAAARQRQVDAEQARLSRKAQVDLANEMVIDQRAAAVQRVPDPDSPQGKRLRYYVRCFQGDFTARVYRAFADAIHQRSRAKSVSGPNFQALPVWRGRMWEGELDVLHYGRLAGPAGMVQIEDWTGPGGFPNCAFAGALIRAAVRTSGATPAALLTGTRSRVKFIAWLSQGIRKFDSYIYGPTWNIGPPWGDDPGSFINIGSALTDIARVEEDILACAPDNQIALLVSNSSEITGKIGGNRVAMFSELGRAAFGADVVSEDDIVLDHRLEHYRLLIVVDQAVRTDVQQAIADWAAKGHAVFITSDACGFDHFEEPSRILDHLRAPPIAPEAMRAELEKRCAAAGVAPVLTTDCEDLWTFRTRGEGRQILFLIKREPDDDDKPLIVRVACERSPREIRSARHGVIQPLATRDGVVEFAFPVPRRGDNNPAHEYPYADIVVIHEIETGASEGADE